MCPALTSNLAPNRCLSKIPIHSKTSSTKRPIRLDQIAPATQHAKQLAVVDPSSLVQRRRLRAKTGCLTCKNRRKKCDEKTPTCDRCALSGRSCTWPTTTDLTDRRYTSHPQSRYGNSPESMLCLRSEKTACDQVTTHLEVVLSRHFVDTYYDLLLLPGCHPAFHDGWINMIQELMVDEKSLHYSMLTNAASHIYNINNTIEMQHLALGYYSKALRGLATIFSRPKSDHLANHDGLLMTVMLLYLHGCMGRGTYFDIPPHLSAAMNILQHRLFDVPYKIVRPFDQLAVESVLFQIFLHSTGLWSEQSPSQSFDVRFWIQAENLLEQSVMFPESSKSSNSPVLGINASLYRLAVQAKLMLQHPHLVESRAVNNLRSEVEFWEGVVLCDAKVEQRLKTDEQAIREQYCESTCRLFALIISLLLEQITEYPATENLPVDNQTFPKLELAPKPASPDSWQVQKAMQIIKKHHGDDAWVSCYIGNWPVYTIGFFLTDPEHIELIRQDMKRRWELTKFSQIPRFQNDLETTWKHRSGLAPVAAVDSSLDPIISTP